MKYQGSCHCGKIAFEVEGEVQNVIECNCSICQRRGHLLWFVPRDKMRLKTPEEGLSTYMFNKKQIKHRFCPVCGCGPFGEGVNPKTGQTTAAINIRCLENVDIAKITRVPFNGRDL